MLCYWYLAYFIVHITSAQYDSPLPPTASLNSGKNLYLPKQPIHRGKGAPAHEPMTYAAQNGYSLETDEEGAYRIGDKAVDGYESLYIEETTVASTPSTTTVATVNRKRLGRSSESEEEIQEDNEAKPYEGSGLDQYAALYLEEQKPEEEHLAVFNTRTTTEPASISSTKRPVVMRTSVIKKDAVNMIIYNELRKPMKEQNKNIVRFDGDSDASIGVRINTSTGRTTTNSPQPVTQLTTKKSYVVISLNQQHNRRRVLDSNARFSLHAGESRQAVHKNQGIWKHLKMEQKKKIVTKRIVMDRSSAKGCVTFRRIVTPVEQTREAREERETNKF